MSTENDQPTIIKDDRGWQTKIYAGCELCEEIRKHYADTGKIMFAPSHDASALCRSGKYAHCTCDTCF